MAESVKHRPQDGGVERPVRQGSGVPRVAHPQKPRRVTNRATEHTDAPGPRTGGEDKRDDDRQGGSERGNRAEREWTAVGDHTDRQRRSREHDRAEEHGVQQDKKREQRARGCRRAETGATQRPQRQASAPGAGRRQQPRGGGSRQRDLGALAHPDPRRRTTGDRREQDDISGDRHALEHDCGRRPPSVHAQGAVKDRGDGVDPVRTEHDGGEHRRAEQRGQERTPSDRAQLERRQREVGDGGVGGDHRAKGSVCERRRALPMVSTRSALTWM